MRFPRLNQHWITFWCVILVSSSTMAEPALDEALTTLQKIGPEGKGHAEAVAVWGTVAAAGSDQLTTILGAMNDENPLADNWIRGAVDAIAERTLSDGGKLPAADLESYVADKSKSGRSRRLAYEWLTQVDSTARDRWATKLLNDTSLELRRDAVAEKIAEGLQADKDQNKQGAIKAYRIAFQHARDLDQIDETAEALKKLGESVDLAAHMGFIQSWQLIGPFDNTDKSGFDKIYPPEQDIELDSDYPGKDQVVRWQEATTEDAYGMVNLNDLLGKHKGALAYAVAEFDASEARDVELRLGCICANKIWLNGELLTANHVYHAGRGIDQYVGKGKLKAGRNVILLKICQNEQTEPWAQDWEFQLRACDAVGTAIISE